MKDVGAVRRKFRGLVNKFLASAYTPVGVEEWWRRPRRTLGGKAANEVLDRPDFDPRNDDAKEVLRLARALVGPGSAV